VAWISGSLWDATCYVLELFSYEPIDGSYFGILPPDAALLILVVHEHG